jgi:hypothetical protein
VTERAVSLLGRIRAPRLLDTTGLGLVTAAAWTVHLGLGLLVAGASCLAISWLTEHRETTP